jgi:pyridoxine 5-phosphate synthase
MIKKNPRLGVNIDHVATLRQARGEEYPSLLVAAQMVLEQGADQITIHLREDRRHIQETDVQPIYELCQQWRKPLNLEVGTSAQMLDWVIKNPYYDWICLVPEHRQERTTEGGLNLLDPKVFQQVDYFCKQLKHLKKTPLISLFLEANESLLTKSLMMTIDAVEIHTGDYARTFLQGGKSDSFLSHFSLAKQLLQQANKGVHAGHGLTDESLKPLVQQNLFEEYNIGHWIISQSVFEGLNSVIQRLKRILTCAL